MFPGSKKSTGEEIGNNYKENSNNRSFDLASNKFLLLLFRINIHEFLMWSQIVLLISLHYLDLNDIMYKKMSRIVCNQTLVTIIILWIFERNMDSFTKNVLNSKNRKIESKFVYYLLFIAYVKFYYNYIHLLVIHYGI